MAHLTTPLAWFELSQAALQHNIETIRQIVGPGVALWPCVKANAYGHGLEPMATLLLETGVDGFSVADFEEAIRLRQHGVQKPIQVMSPISDSHLPEALDQQIWVWVHDLEQAKRLAHGAANQSSPLAIVVKVDTGMGRLGVSLTEVEALLHFVQTSPQLRLMSVATHFATADLGDDLFLQQQEAFACVKQAVQRIMSEQTILFQSSNSGALLRIPHQRGDLVRPGLATYGYWPSVATQQLARSRQVALQPVLSWKTQLVQMKTLEHGANIGYGGKTQSTKPTQLGILPIGYAHGLDHRLSNQGSVLAGSQPVKILGNVCMNVAMVDLTEVPTAQVGDEVILIGHQGEVAQTAEELATQMGTIVYAVLVNLAPWIERRLVP
ncbi:MAG: alanine racemase [Caldilineaceae bacterium]|nr:alanine racemase [Caldilineaceae bacterium]